MNSDHFLEQVYDIRDDKEAEELIALYRLRMSPEIWNAIIPHLRTILTLRKVRDEREAREKRISEASGSV